MSQTALVWSEPKFKHSGTAGKWHKIPRKTWGTPETMTND